MTTELPSSLSLTHKERDMPDEKGLKYYQKLWKCLLKAIWNTDELGCHANDIIVHLAKSIESQQLYYDPTHDAWCDYFLKMKVKKK